MNGLKITCFERVTEGAQSFYRAHVSVDGHTVEADNRYGSWRLGKQLRPRVVDCPPRHAVFPVAAALQAKVPRAERGRR